MSSLKLIYHLFIGLIISSAAIYYMGCASAESTTGKLAFQQQDYQKAEVELKKGLQVDKTDDEGWYMLGFSQIQIGKYDDAKKSFEECKKISSNYNDKITAFWIEKFNAGAAEFKGGIDAESRKDSASAQNYYKNALRQFEASYAINPDSLKSLKAIGESYLALGERDKAKEIFTEILSKSKTKEDAEKVAAILFDAGLGMMQVENYSDAAAVFKNIVNIPALPKDDPYSETSAYNVGLAYAKWGEKMRTEDENSNYKEKFSEALVYLEPLTTGLKTKKLEPQLWELLVSVYANLGMNEKAQDALNKKDSLKGSN